MRGPFGGGLAGGSVLPPLANLVLWFDGSSTAKAFADFAGALPSVAPYGRVARIDQPALAPAGQWRTADQANHRAFRDLAGIDIQYGSAARFAQPTGLSVNTQNCTFAFALQNRTSLSQVSGVFEGYDGVGYWGVTIGGTLVIWCAATTFDTGIVVPDGAFAYGFVKYSNTTTSGTIVVNGVATNFSFNAANASYVNNVNYVGSMVSNNYHAQLGVSTLLAYSTTSVDAVQLLAYLKSVAASPFPLDVPFLAVAGDSISQGATATAGLSMFYASQYNLAQVNPTPPRMLQDGFSGRGLPTLITAYPTEIKPFFDARRSRNIIAVQAITNSMPCSTANAAAIAAQVLSLLYGYCDQAKADGWRVILFTCLPRADSGSGTGFPTAWNTVNTDIRANYLAHSHVLADVSAVAGMSTIADAATGPNFSDQLHPNDAGQALLTPTVQAAIASQL